tara:strand:- start:603 stop:1415 length:813 start_codon:yes stop_codon:yes gene_type:complete
MLSLYALAGVRYMELRFFKYQGTGNDFIMLNGMENQVELSKQQVRKFCHRRFGIGADGLIILKPHAEFNFEMDYYNADGSQSFCGNGSRCAQAFARALGIISDKSTFWAIDGAHEGKYDGKWYATKMHDVSKVKLIGEDFLIDTGSPHYIQFVSQLDELDVYEAGRTIRYSKPFAKEGVNVNFISLIDGVLHVRTYERGVEAETYSCGTGVTASAIAYLHKHQLWDKEVPIETKGGRLKIMLNREDECSFKQVWLCGPAEKVFEGVLHLD